MKAMTIRVSRYDPAHDAEPHFEEYTVRVNEGARVLHALHAIRDEHDPTLAYRYCCGSGQCGSCAVRVDGTPVLACMAEARDGMTVEPLDLPVLKDLTVEMTPVIAKIARICPAPDAHLPAREEIEAIKPLRDCIECLCCVSACPALQVTEFAG
ncbi:MAG TPA: 2Fe-2S iron-sulfur cluster-binding protein, partial [Methanoculleus sp.]|nr:2Fe-2S iron-sulfur cluster-binding protein [Methanoculleus sp.]